MKAFLVVNPRIVQSRARYDLLVDGVEVLHEVLYIQAMQYALDNMADDDTYRETHMTTPNTGKELRAQHNSMERYYAEDNRYKPKYYPSPTTGEVEFKAV